jgi:hypothetical protein
MINSPAYPEFRDSTVLPSTVGFFLPKPGGYSSAGTGTFVRIGNIHGILTCAHVLDAIKEQRRVDLAIFPVRAMSNFISLNVMNHCSGVKFGPSCSADGPDLAFLRIPTAFVENISHLVTIRNMELGREHAFADTEPSQKSMTVVSGVIDEWSQVTQSTEGGQSNRQFCVKGLISIGRIEEAARREQFDYFRFRPTPDEDFPVPSSYAGTSGGGLWRYYPDPDDGSEVAYRLIGVAFYETEDGQIICHAQGSLYVTLFDAVREEWPDE